MKAYESLTQGISVRKLILSSVTVFFSLFPSAMSSLACSLHISIVSRNAKIKTLVYLIEYVTKFVFVYQLVSM